MRSDKFTIYRGYDATGAMTALRESGSGSSGRTLTPSYDALGNLASAGPIGYA